jgi:hypothetical protein
MLEPWVVTVECVVMVLSMVVSKAILYTPQHSDARREIPHDGREKEYKDGSSRFRPPGGGWEVERDVGGRSKEMWVGGRKRCGWEVERDVSGRSKEIIILIIIYKSL